MSYATELTRPLASFLAEEEPLPLLLVLGPTMGGPPWAQAVARAAATVQFLDTGEGLDEGVRATLAYAVAYLRVESVVVCAEGPGAPDRAGAVGIRRCAEKFARAIDAMGGAGRPRVDVLWHDTDSGALYLDSAERYAAPWDTLTRAAELSRSPAERLCG